MNSTTKTILVIAGIAAVAAGGYYFWKRSKSGATPVVVDSANSNQRSNSDLANNINAGTNAFNSLTKALGYGAV